MDRSEDALYQAKQRTIAIFDEYYASICEEQARREATHIAEREEERKQAAFLRNRCTVGEKYKSYMSRGTW